jgi:hypothetical protein
MLHHKIETRKRRTENYACEISRKVQATRQKHSGQLYFNRTILGQMRSAFTSEEFVSKIPGDVVRAFIRQNQHGGFEHFLSSRNSRAHTPDLEWLSKTEAYKMASSWWVEHRVRDTIRRQIPVDTLREYRQRQVPLQIMAVPSMQKWRDHSEVEVTLPYGSNIFVNQVLSNSVRIALSISDTDTTKDPFTLSLSDAWDIVAGPPVTSVYNRLEIRKSDDWLALPTDPDALQHALLRILQDDETKSTLPILGRGDSRLPCCQLVREGDGSKRSIEFRFEQRTLVTYRHVFNSIDFPAEIRTCIAGYLWGTQPSYYERQCYAKQQTTDNCPPQ